jgi:hypothetical protein
MSDDDFIFFGLPGQWLATGIGPSKSKLKLQLRL